MADYDLDQDDECPFCGGPLASDGVCADDDCGDNEPFDPDQLIGPDDILPPAVARLDPSTAP